MPGPGARWATAIGGPLALGAAAGGGAFAWGALVERRLYTLREVSVPVLPDGAIPIKVLHLSDLHMAPWQRGKQEWVASLAALAPDLIVDTGDNLGHPRGIEGVRRALDPFRGVPGVYVHGSNDYFGPTPKHPLRYFLGPSKPHRKRPTYLDVASLEAYFDELGWLNLNNDVGQLTVRGTRLEFFGVDDPHRQFDSLPDVTAKLDDLRGAEVTDTSWPAEEDDAAPTVSVGVTHAPYQRVLNSFVTNGASLILAGHTHGGQVCLPGYGALVTNCDIPRQQVKGLSMWPHALRSAYLNVSAGVGTSIYAPFRFACRPEATLLRLVPRRA